MEKSRDELIKQIAKLEQEKADLRAALINLVWQDEDGFQNLDLANAKEILKKTRSVL